jgi:hypothetical protein
VPVLVVASNLYLKGSSGVALSDKKTAISALLVGEPSKWFSAHYLDGRQQTSFSFVFRK